MEKTSVQRELDFCQEHLQVSDDEDDSVDDDDGRFESDDVRETNNTTVILLLIMMTTMPTTPTPKMTTVVLSITFLQQPTMSKVKMRETHCGSVSLLLPQSIIIQSPPVFIHNT